MSGAADDHPYATQLAMRARLDAVAAPVAFVDLGTDKIAVLIAEPADEGGRRSFRVLGAAAPPAAGVSAGVPTDLDAAEAALGRAFEEAASIARRRPAAAVATLSGLEPKSVFASADVALADGAVRREDVARAIAEATPPDEGDARFRLHGIAARWRIDGAPALGDPVGRFGRRLSATMLSVSVAREAAKRLARVLRAVGLELIAAATAPYAAALATTTAEERAMGALLIDVGAATTSIALFERGRLAAAAAAPVGGEQVTEQIARSFGIGRDDAERLKIREGSAAANTRAGALRVERTGAAPLSVQRHALTAAIRPRALEILEAARDRASEAGFFGPAARPVVVTGGGGDLAGFGAAAEEVFGPRVRVAGPTGREALTEIATKGAWAASVGLVRFAAGAPEQRFEGIGPAPSRSAGFWRWLRETW